MISRYSGVFCLLALALGAAGCEEETTTTTWRRCQPALLSLTPNQSSGVADETAELVGRHVLSYEPDPIDPIIDVAVKFGPDSAPILRYEGPVDVDTTDTDGIVDDCTTCSECVIDNSEGCGGCETECASCLTTVVVAIPARQGADLSTTTTVPVSFVSGLGYSNSLDFVYPGVSPTPSPTP